MKEFQLTDKQTSGLITALTLELADAKQEEKDWRERVKICANDKNLDQYAQACAWRAMVEELRDIFWKSEEGGA